MEAKPLPPVLQTGTFRFATETFILTILSSGKAPARLSITTLQGAAIFTAKQPHSMLAWPGSWLTAPSLSTHKIEKKTFCPGQTMIEIVEKDFGPFENPQIKGRIRFTKNGKHFLASTSNPGGRGVETLIFEVSGDGEINWINSAGDFHNGVDLTKGNPMALIRDLSKDL